MYRAYHAMRGGGLSGPGGKTTHAVYIFVNMLRKLIQDHQPQYIGASFDLPGRTFRDDLVSDYKANRTPMPSDLAEQIPWVHEACEALGVPIITSERYEADDVIGTLATKAAAAGFEVAIVTGDKDFFQLVHDGIKVYNPRDDGAWFDADGVKENSEWLPSRWSTSSRYGDSIDTLKGVGIGEKGARDLIAQYGTLEELLAHAGEVSNKRYREGLLGTPPTRGRAVSWRASGSRAVEFDVEARLSRTSRSGRSRTSPMGFRTLVMEYAPPRTPSQGLRVDHQRGRVRALSRSSVRGRFALRVRPDAPSAMSPGLPASPSRRRNRARYIRSRASPAATDLFGQPEISASTRASSSRRRWRCCGRCWRIRRSRKSVTT